MVSKQGVYRLFLLLILFFIVGSPLKAQFGFALEDQIRKVKIPFTVQSNLIVVPLILNKRLPLKFILDTGVRNAILTDKTYSDILNIPYSRKYTITGAGGEKLVDAYVTNNVTLSLPGIDGKGHAMLVLEEDYIKLRNFLGVEVQGMLGYELFSRFVVRINYQKRVLTLTKPDFFRKPKFYQEFDMHLEDTKPFIYLPLTMSDGTVLNAKLLVDTGASHGLMLDPLSSDSVFVPEIALDANIGRGLGGKIEGQLGRIQSISFKKHIIENPIVSFPYPNSYMDSLTASGTFRHGSIGGEILSRFSIILDYSSEKIYLKRNTAFHRPFYFNLSGVTVRAVGSLLKTFEIEEVREGSTAAEAGVKSGDRLLFVNGITISSMNLGQVNGLLNSRPGRKLRIIVLRNGEPLKFQFRLASSI